MGGVQEISTLSHSAVHTVVRPVGVPVTAWIVNITISVMHNCTSSITVTSGVYSH